MAILGYENKKKMISDLTVNLMTQWADLLEHQAEKIAINLAEYFENWLKKQFKK